MIKIKDYIFNEKDIRYIQEYDFDEYTQISICTKEQQFIKVNNATFEDIEWNYGTPQETQRQMQKELCKSCYYRDTISNEVERLEKSNKTFEDYNKDLNRQIEKLEEEISKKHIREVQQKNIEYAGRINKAIELIKEYYPTSTIYYQDEKDEIIKVLKGE